MSDSLLSVPLLRDVRFADADQVQDLHGLATPRQIGSAGPSNLETQHVLGTGEGRRPGTKEMPPEVLHAPRIPLADQPMRPQGRATGPHYGNVFAYASGSYRPWGTGPGWVGQDVRQGDFGFGPHWGVWAYGGNLTGAREWFWAHGIWGGWVTRVWIYVQRASSGGTSAWQAIHFWTHGDIWAPGVPNIWNYIGAMGGLAWGQAAWIELPAWVAQGLVDQSANGIAIGLSGVPYVINNGVNVNGWSGCLQFEYYMPDPTPPQPTQPGISSPETLFWGTVGQPYEDWFRGWTESGQFQWEVWQGQWNGGWSSWPPGLNFPVNPGESHVWGTPTQAGEFWFVLRLWDTVSWASVWRWTRIIIFSPLEISTTQGDIPEGQVDEWFEIFFASSGGMAPVGWRVSSGFTPPGTQIFPDGRYNGVPQQTGTYNFTVDASDASGQVVSRAFTQEVIPGIPRPPTGIWAEPSNMRAYIHWTAPTTTGGSPITGYRIEWATNGTTSSVTVGNVTTHLITGLTNGTPYRFRVQAINAIGNGQWSEWSPAYTPFPSVPFPPQNVIAVAGYGGATVGWSPPADDGGLPIIGYRIVGVPTTGPVVTVEVPHDQLEVEVLGLRGVPYTFRVYAANDAGWSAASEITGAVTPTPALRIITLQLPSAQQGEIYQTQIRTENGVMPFTWEVIQGQLPLGLRLDQDGFIRGRPA